MSPKTMALVRHPAPDIAPGLCYGRLDIGLSAAGHAALPALIADLAPFRTAQIWSSPARRCRIAADAIAAHYNQTPTIDPRLQELGFGDWEGRAWNEIPRTALDQWAADPETFTPPGGESGQALLTRIKELHEAITATPLIIITHGGPLKILTALLRNTTPNLLSAAPPIGSITVIAPPASSTPGTPP